MADSGSSTPNPRFASQAVSTEDVLKEQTYGLVHLSDFRKRRAEAIEQGASVPGSGTTTPDGREPAAKAVFKKRKKTLKKGGLSFGNDEDEDETAGDTSSAPTPAATSSRTATPTHDAAPTDSEDPSDTVVKKRLKPNASLSHAPKAMTKSALLRETQLKEDLRRQYLAMQEAVKATEFMLPFTFYDGKSHPGGSCRMKKGDHIWLFLERARKLGADLAGKGDWSKKDWARISVDDLMVVKGDLIVPHHYDFHYFILNRSVGYDTKPLFSYSADPTPATPVHLLPSKTRSASSKTGTPEPLTANNNDVLSTAASRAEAKAQQIADSELEGYNDDPALTKVVDRRWYERNKHIYPASTWEDFDPAHDYSTGGRKDRLGNAFFFGRR